MNTLPILYQRLFFINHILSYFSTRKNTMEYRTGKPEVYSWTSLQRVSLSLVRGLFKATLRLNPCRLCICDYFSPSWSSWTAWTRWPWERWWQMQSVGRDCSHGVQSLQELQRRWRGLDFGMGWMNSSAMERFGVRFVSMRGFVQLCPKVICTVWSACFFRFLIWRISSSFKEPVFPWF